MTLLPQVGALDMVQPGINRVTPLGDAGSRFTHSSHGGAGTGCCLVRPILVLVPCRSRTSFFGIMSLNGHGTVMGGNGYM